MNEFIGWGGHQRFWLDFFILERSSKRLHQPRDAEAPFQDSNNAKQLTQLARTRPKSLEI